MHANRLSGYWLELTNSCQELVMRLKTETLVDANGSAVVFKDIQDNMGEVLFEPYRLKTSDTQIGTERWQMLPLARST
jgi:hypothetical protein